MPDNLRLLMELVKPLLQLTISQDLEHVHAERPISLALQHLNDVPAIFSLHWATKLAGLELECHIVKRFGHIATREPAEISAIDRRCRIDAQPLGEISEISTLLQLRNDRFGGVFR